MRVKYKKIVCYEQLRAGGRIQDHRHNRDRSAPALEALLKIILTFRTAPLDARHVPEHQAQPESVEGRMNNVADRLAGLAQELERPGDMLPAAGLTTRDRCAQ